MEIDRRYQEGGEKGRLRYGIIEVTRRCQLRCQGCYLVRRNQLGKVEMSLGEAIHVLDLCREFLGHDLETMDILGGEPLLWPYLKDYIEVLIGRGIKPWIFTNMLAVNAEMARWLFERQINITGKWNIADVNDSEQLRLQGELAGGNEIIARKMYQAMKIFQAVGYRDPLFRLENLLRRANLNLVPGFLRFCKEENLGYDIEVVGSGEGLNLGYYEIAPTARELANLVRDLQQQELPDLEERLLMPHLVGSCCFFDRGLYFATDGSIRACSNSTRTLASITDPNPVRTAWNSPLLCSRRNLSQATMGEPCHSCDRWEKCRGGCRATAEGMGDANSGYPLCPLPILRQE